MDTEAISQGGSMQLPCHLETQGPCHSFRHLMSFYFGPYSGPARLLFYDRLTYLQNGWEQGHMKNHETTDDQISALVTFFKAILTQVGGFCPSKDGTLCGFLDNPPKLGSKRDRQIHPPIRPFREGSPKRCGMAS